MADDAPQLIEPETPDELAHVLASASASRHRVLLRGGGTKAAWGGEPGRVDRVVCTRRLDRVIAHQHGDLTVTVEAGLTLEELNRQLARSGQWLPLESAFAGATIGGVLATNESGPLRQRYGTPRDLLIGIRLATTDGRVVKAGGAVVKNVAGYDLGKLVTGSFGSLAAIVGATFKLTPAPAAFVTRLFAFDTHDRAAAAAAALAAAPLAAVALELRTSSETPMTTEVLVRFGSSLRAADSQASASEQLVHDFSGRDGQHFAADDDAALWREHRHRPWGGEGSVLSAGWLPASLGDVLVTMDALRRGGARIELVCRAGLGCGLLRVDADIALQIQAIEQLRARRDLFTHVAVLRAPREVYDGVDPWPDPGGIGPLLAALKRAFDPAGVLNAGRGHV